MGLLIAYAAALGVNLIRGRRELDCGCGMSGNRRPIAAWMVWRNLFVALALGIAVLPWAARPLDAADLLDGDGRPGGGRRALCGHRSIARRSGAASATAPRKARMTALAVSNVTLWFVVIGLSLALLAVVRQLGVLHERIAPVGALMLAKGLKVGEFAPTVTVQDLEGRSLTLGAARADERATLLMFVSPTCPVCKALLPVLKSSLASEREWLDIILASDGENSRQREFVLAHRLGGFPYVVSAPLGMAYQVSRLPFAVLIDAQGVLRARGIVNSREHLESLFEAKRLGFASIQDYFEAAAEHQAA
jgi:methylamine dehydrogenase accessory protein MauD